jgi:SAM-dependent methyltransferase
MPGPHQAHPASVALTTTQADAITGSGMSTAQLHSAAAVRNRDPILAVLRRVLPGEGLVLEIASGTGEHAAYFGEAFPQLAWQPSDPDPRARASVAAWCAGVPTVRPPLALDATDERWPVEPAAIVCVNMIHIAPWSACEGLLRGAGRALPPGGVLYLYGPYRIDGRHTAPSNATFDAGLRAQDPAWGVRDLETVVTLAASHGLDLRETVSMPANNLSVILERRQGGSRDLHVSPARRCSERSGE